MNLSTSIKYCVTIIFTVAGVLFVQTVLTPTVKIPPKQTVYETPNSNQANTQNEYAQQATIQELNLQLDNIVNDQKNTKLTSAMLYEELDKIKRALDALTELSEDNLQAVNDLEPLTESEKNSIYDQQITATSELYSQTLNMEPNDPAWSSEAETEITNYIAGTDNKMLAQSIECKQTLCQVEIHRGDDVLDEEALEAFDSQVNWPGEMAMIYNPATGSGTVYLGRDGHPLPRLPGES